MSIDVCRVSLLMLLKAVCSPRPHLDYASQVWLDLPQVDLMNLRVECGHQEAVQHRATKLLVGNRVSYKEHLNKREGTFFLGGGGLGNFGIFSKRKCWPSLTF